MSLDGFVAGPDQSEENPLGVGGMQLHQWAFALAAWRRPHGQAGGVANASTQVVEASLQNIGATVMGRNMFGGSGPWADSTYTRPEQVQNAIEMLEKHQVQFVMWSAWLDAPRHPGDDGTAGPLRVYLRAHYHPVRDFDDQYAEVWERKRRRSRWPPRQA